MVTTACMILVADAELRAAAAAATAAANEAEEKCDLTSSQVALLSVPAEANNEPEMENEVPETKCTSCFFRIFVSRWLPKLINNVFVHCILRIIHFIF